MEEERFTLRVQKCLLAVGGQRSYRTLQLVSSSTAKQLWVFAHGEGLGNTLATLWQRSGMTDDLKTSEAEILGEADRSKLLEPAIRTGALSLKFHRNRYLRIGDHANELHSVLRKSRSPCRYP